MHGEVRSTILNSQIEAHITYIVTWLTNYYIPQTNPLNRITRMKSLGTDVEMERYGHPFNDDPMTPDTCGLGEKIDHSMHAHAIGDSNHNRYGAQLYRSSDPEYISRLEDYIKCVKIADLPCQSCLFLGDCKQQVNVFLFLNEAEFTPTEEGYIAMLYEIHLYRFSFNNRRNRGYYFVEESIGCSSYDDPSEFYDKIIESNICVKRWYINDGAELEANTLSWTSERFSTRLSEIMQKSDRDRLGLLRHALDEKSEFAWSMDNVMNFRSRRGR